MSGRSAPASILSNNRLGENLNRFDPIGSIDMNEGPELGSHPLDPLDMPQPVHYSKKIGFDFRPERILDRPKLAAQIAVASALWNEIEARTGAMLAALLGSEATTVVSMFLALQNDGAKRAAIDTVCKLKMSASQFAEFQKIQQEIGKRYADRNRMVHGAWGVSDLYPDALLWADTRDVTLFHTKMLSLAAPEHNATRAALEIKYQQKLLVYKEGDFIAVQDRIRTAYNLLCDFSRPIMENAFQGFAKIDWHPTAPQK